MDKPEMEPNVTKKPIFTGYNALQIFMILCFMLIDGILLSVSFGEITKWLHIDKAVMPATSEAPAYYPPSWFVDRGDWMSSGEVPQCYKPSMWGTMVDASHLSSLTLPGQYRQGVYQSDASLTITTAPNEYIPITSPGSGSIARGERYTQNGQEYDSILVVNGCGMAYRFDGLPQPASTVKEALKGLPVSPQRTGVLQDLHRPYGYYSVIFNDMLGKAGSAHGGAAEIGYGLYDLRHRNPVSNNAAWLAKHTDGQEYAAYGVCWFSEVDSLKEQQYLQSLASQAYARGETSDYCAPQ